jgi:hypothetical protein
MLQKGNKDTLAQLPQMTSADGKANTLDTPRRRQASRRQTPLSGILPQSQQTAKRGPPKVT